MPQWNPSNTKTPPSATTYQSPYEPANSLPPTKTTNSVNTTTAVSVHSVYTYSTQSHDNTFYPYNH